MAFEDWAKIVEDRLFRDIDSFYDRAELCREYAAEFSRRANGYTEQAVQAQNELQAAKARKCSGGRLCVLHENRCFPTDDRAIARCWECGKNIMDRSDLSIIGSQGHLTHGEWLLCYCKGCHR